MSRRVLMLDPYDAKAREWVVTKSGASSWAGEGSLPRSRESALKMAQFVAKAREEGRRQELEDRKEYRKQFGYTTKEVYVYLHRIREEMRKDIAWSELTHFSDTWKTVEEYCHELISREERGEGTSN